jgi:hypothetical protein
MSEQRMIEMIEAALGEMGIQDRIVAAGEFRHAATPGRCSSVASPAAK